MKQTSAADSKPIGWYCPRLGVTWRNPRHHAEECWGDYQCLEKLSPIYLPPPAPVTAEEQEPVRTWTCTTPEKAMPKTKKTPRIRQESIPSFTPLAVPEVTTWGESGGEEAITLYDSLVSANRWMLGDNFRALVDHYRDIYWMAEHSKGLVEGDVVRAMNFLERSKK